ncbi:hypothetical protein IEQ34_023314 [Dendrobium chrysotoxum]|uniref:NAD(P)H-quinone oxidoreductase subunit 5, chloroplastic n=1 Tax=Dendrobium chrysotoxum TaxID=161865 RepID=A0AAV7FWJ1_DENCH|nr:hypothetical protein IEQ34_023314 [Dendrobium chrysotoxum]
MSQLGYIMLALGIGSYRAAFFHLITHAYSKAFLMYLLTFDGYLRIHFPENSSLSSTKKSSFYSISLWGKGTLKKVNRNFFSWRNNRFGSIIEMAEFISFSKEVLKELFWTKEKVLYTIGHIIVTGIFTMSIRGLAELTQFFDKYLIDGILNGIGVASFFMGEGIKYIGGGRISSYFSFLFLFFQSSQFPIRVSRSESS